MNGVKEGSALRWVIRNAKTYGINPDRLVVTGQSAGGHLALMTGMLPESAGLDRQCPGTEDLKVAAIVNWYGITDVNELLDGPNLKPYAVTWLGSAPDRDQTAKRVSPLTYVRPGLPPVFTIHGDADPTVPYAHAVRRHKALDDAGVPNELMTTPGGTHGYSCCTLDQRTPRTSACARSWCATGCCRTSTTHRRPSTPQRVPPSAY